jgi:1,4-alpha-glucan branching enzyme
MVSKIPAALKRIIEARHHDPFEVLGQHLHGDACLIRVFMPQAEKVTLEREQLPFRRLEGTDLFELETTAGNVSSHYRLEWRDKSGQIHKTYDPYCFPPLLPEFDLHLFSEGKHRKGRLRCMGAIRS